MSWDGCQGGDYELHEWLVFLSVEVVEHHACQEWQQARSVLSLPEVGLEFPHHTACSLVVMLELHISPLHCFWVYANSHFFIIIQNCYHRSVHITSFVTILKYLFWLQVSNCMFTTKLMMNHILMNGIFYCNSLDTPTHLMLSLSCIYFIPLPRSVHIASF